MALVGVSQEEANLTEQSLIKYIDTHRSGSKTKAGEQSYRRVREENMFYHLSTLL